VLATAPTGTGKTAAYLLPLIGRLMHCSRDSLPRNKAYPAAVILVPTHELVLQVCVCACVCVLCVCVCVCVCCQVYEECAALVRATLLKLVLIHHHSYAHF
jgi:superfamily II DNA/RNA helicase